MEDISRKKISEKYSLNPAQILVLGFVAMILIGAGLLTLPAASANGESVGFVNAIFTATSAVCVTGLVVGDTASYWTLFGKGVILILIQVGGLGFMTMTTLIALVVGRRISLKERLLMQEALNQVTISGVVRLTKNIIIGTIAIETIGAAFLSFRFVPMYGWAKGIGFAVFHSVSAFCNAGFDLMGNFGSLARFADDALVTLSVGFLIILGGLGFTVLVDLFEFGTAKKRINRRFSLHSKLTLYMTGILILIGFISIFVFEFNNPQTMGNLSGKGKILSSLFHSITPRTAGFNTISMDGATLSTKILTIILMFVGGAPGSTAGGIKVTTFGILLFTMASMANGRDETEIFKRRIPRDIVNRALALVSASFTIVIVGTMLLSFTETGVDFMDILFETTSAFGTVGLSLGITPHLSNSGKIIIAFVMFIGRLGPMTLAVAVAHRQQKRKKLIKYPEGKVSVG